MGGAEIEPLYELPIFIFLNIKKEALIQYTKFTQPFYFERSSFSKTSK